MTSAKAPKRQSAKAPKRQRAKGPKGQRAKDRITQTRGAEFLSAGFGRILLCFLRFDGNSICCPDSRMRTTVTVDPDTEYLLKEEARRTGRSFKFVLNQAIRSGLAGRQKEPVTVEPIFPAPFPKSLENANFNRLAEEWEDEETLDELTP